MQLLAKFKSKLSSVRKQEGAGLEELSVGVASDVTEEEEHVTKDW